jgi:hypothetical protein
MSTQEWIDLSDIPRRPQAQDDLRSQIKDMWALANHFGLRDAADWLLNLDVWPESAKRP